MKVLAVAFIIPLLIALAAGINGVWVKANFLPTPNTEMMIESPQNKSYTVTTITLNFSVETNSALHFFYSLDYNELKPIENLTIVSEELLNWIPPCTYYRKTLIGSCIFSNLSEGSHRLTVYQLYYSTEDPRTEDVASSASANFWITIPTEVPEFKSPWSPPTTPPVHPPQPFPTPWLIAIMATVFVLGSGLLFYFWKRKKE